ncbi:hypothetical protein BJ994_000303 [Arthrobacter pigmenti]|uniref:Uncharacterized protein n=1 Tax=Arthrobacter pigmenti TaxID=271432 RepID=A0A846RM65_9MICC|nr:hypothetical protein [Arthrobacter pigmenti]NJC21227.1 hypothetical protein [Arthrobacter pigmenti]
MNSTRLGRDFGWLWAAYSASSLGTAGSMASAVEANDASAKGPTSE